jgi:hypothetical protein
VAWVLAGVPAATRRGGHKQVAGPECWSASLREFAHNPRQLRGCPGAVAVLHTHSRALELHPHVYLALPAAALDEARRLWRRA